MSWMSSQERLRVSSNSSLNAVVPQGFFWEHASRWYIRSSASTACWELYVLKRLLLSQTKLCRLCPFLMPGAVRGGCGVTWPHVLTLTPALQETCMSKIIYAYNKASWDKYKYDDPHGFWGGGGGINPVWTIVLISIFLAFLSGRCIIYFLSTIRALHLQTRLCVRLPGL